MPRASHRGLRHDHHHEAERILHRHPEVHLQQVPLNVGCWFRVRDRRPLGVERVQVRLHRRGQNLPALASCQDWDGCRRLGVEHHCAAHVGLLFFRVLPAAHLRFEGRLGGVRQDAAQDEARLSLLDEACLGLRRTGYCQGAVHLRAGPQGAVQGEVVRAELELPRMLGRSWVPQVSWGLGERWVLQPWGPQPWALQLEVYRP